MHTEIAIIGGGIAGLALADRLHRAGADFHLFEARSRFGGRIRTQAVDGAGFDLGPSWFWPGQPRIAALARRFGLRVFDQHAAGSASFEDETGRVQRGRGFASMAGALRIDGGMVALTDALTAALPADRLHLNAQAVHLTQAGGVRFAKGAPWTATRVFMAVPPRVAAGIRLDPCSPDLHRHLEAIPTWMGGHAKLVAVYDRPFWRDAALSGDAISRLGPLVEIHDATAVAGQPAALFGFVGVPATARTGHDAALRAAALDQLARIFGPQASSPREVLYLDWAAQAFSASDLDAQPPRQHPAYAMPAALRGIWGGRLTFCSTEVAPEMGGFIEGALAAAEAAAAGLAPDVRRRDG